MWPSQQTYHVSAKWRGFLSSFGFISPGLQVYLLAFHLLLRTGDRTRTEQIVAQEIAEPEEWAVWVRRSRRVRERFHLDKLQKVVVALWAESSCLAPRVVHDRI